MAASTNQQFGDALRKLLRKYGPPQLSMYGIYGWMADNGAPDPKTMTRWVRGEHLPLDHMWEKFLKALRKGTPGPDPSFDRDISTVESLRLRWLSRHREAAGRQSQPSTARESGTASGLALSEEGQQRGAAGPFHVPALPAHAVRGRTGLLREVIRGLRLDQPGERDVPPLAIWGMPGVGKTTAANALVHRAQIQAWFSDGIAWVTLGPTPPVRQLLNGLGATFGTDLIPQYDDDACRMQLRGVLHARRVLVVIDDVWEPEHGAKFLVTGPFGRTILTTRESPVAYPLATASRSIRVDVLTPAAAFAVLRDLAPAVVHRDSASAKILCEKLGYLPLTVTLAGNLLALEADVPARVKYVIAELTERREARLRLAQVGSRPGLPAERPVTVAAMIAMSVDRLGRIDQDRFAMSATFGAEPRFWIVSHAAAVWDCSLEEAQATTSQLVQRGLIQRRRSGDEDEYWMHSLLWDYAEELKTQKGL